VGFGTYLSRSGDECYDAVREAIKTGYRHIDTAAFYENEQSVGQAIKDSGIKREEIFVTTKLWNDDQGYDKTMRAFEKSYKNLGLDYIDLYLIHWPIPKGREHDYLALNAGSWRAFAELRSQKLIRSMGVSNFLPEHIDDLIAASDITPAVNQIELHPALPQNETVKYCEKHGIIVEAWRPILKGEADKHFEGVLRPFQLRKGAAGFHHTHHKEQNKQRKADGLHRTVDADDHIPDRAALELFR